MPRDRTQRPSHARLVYARPDSETSMSARNRVAPPHPCLSASTSRTNGATVNSSTGRISNRIATELPALNELLNVLGNTPYGFPPVPVTVDPLALAGVNIERDEVALDRGPYLCMSCPDAFTPEEYTHYLTAQGHGAAAITIASSDSTGDQQTTDGHVVPDFRPLGPQQPLSGHILREDLFEVNAQAIARLQEQSSNEGSSFEDPARYYDYTARPSTDPCNFDVYLGPRYTLRPWAPEAELTEDELAMCEAYTTILDDE